MRLKFLLGKTPLSRKRERGFEICALAASDFYHHSGRRLGFMAVRLNLEYGVTPCLALSQSGLTWLQRTGQLQPPPLRLGHVS
jgi:hypothetical protein